MLNDSKSVTIFHPIHNDKLASHATVVNVVTKSALGFLPQNFEVQ